MHNIRKCGNRQEIKDEEGRRYKMTLAISLQLCFRMLKKSIVHGCLDFSHSIYSV